MSLKQEQKEARMAFWNKIGEKKPILILKTTNTLIDTLVAQAYKAGADAMMEGVEQEQIKEDRGEWGSQAHIDNLLAYGHNALVQKLKEKRSNI